MAQEGMRRSSYGVAILANKVSRRYAYTLSSAPWLEILRERCVNPQSALRVAADPSQLNDIQTLHQNAHQQIQHTLSNIPSAIQFIVDAGKSHPNRIDVCLGAEGGTAPGTASGGAFGGGANAFQTAAQPANPFGAPAAPATTTGAFGQPAALGQKPNPFGAPAAASPFGQPSALGGTSAFSRPAQPAGAFGQPTALGAKPNPFGAPTLGQPAQPAFGQSGFAQPSALGVKPNPFGTHQAGGGAFAATQPAPANNPFGQPAQQAQPAPSPFGQPAANNQPANNPFGQPPAAQANPFGQPATAPANPFGQPQTQQQPAANPFGQPQTQQQPAANPFGQPQAQQQPAANPFGAPTTSTPAANPFGQPAAAPPANPFGQPGTSASTSAPAAGSSGTGPYGPNATRQHPDISAYSARNPDKTLRMFKGKPVSYEEPRGGGKPVPVLRNFDGTTVRIWMPNGAPAYTTQTEADPAAYEDPAVLQQWRAFVETGRFAGGLMPEVPPKREFCAWDF